MQIYILFDSDVQGWTIVAVLSDFTAAQQWRLQDTTRRTFETFELDKWEEEAQPKDGQQIEMEL